MRDGLSRRDMIKGAAAAGAAVWTAPMIIDSLTSPAAAASGCSGTSVTLSWIYILYRVNGVYFVTAFNNTTNSTTCGAGGSNPHGSKCTSGCGTGVSFTLNTFSGTPDPAANEATYSTSDTCGGAQSNAWTFATSATCGTYIVFSGGQITSKNGAEILAAVGFGGNVGLRAICPSSAGPGNSVCGIET